MMFCKKCGGEVAENAKFCPKCGAGLEKAGLGENKNPKREGVNRKKRIIEVVGVVLLCVLFSMILDDANAKSCGYFENGGIYYEIKSDGTVTAHISAENIIIDGIPSKFYELKMLRWIPYRWIPSKIWYGLKMYRVGCVGWSYGYGYPYCLVSVKISDGVAEIGERAFDGCFRLRSVKIPASVTEIGKDAFNGCIRLRSVKIPASVTKIGDYAFTRCRSLTSVEIPASVTKIGDYAFWDCSSLTSVEISDGVTEIGKGAFSMCNSLTSIKIPASVTEIGVSAFSECSSLTSIKIPASVTEIGDYAFSECSSLTTVEIASSQTKFDPECAFRRCPQLQSVIVEGVEKYR